MMFFSSLPARDTKYFTLDQTVMVFHIKWLFKPAALNIYIIQQKNIPANIQFRALHSQTHTQAGDFCWRRDIDKFFRSATFKMPVWRQRSQPHCASNVCCDFLIISRLTGPGTRRKRTAAALAASFLLSGIKLIFKTGLLLLRSSTAAAEEHNK
jgi:hypothetical protein